MRPLKTAAVFAAVAGGAIALLGPPSAQAAVLSLGPTNAHPSNGAFGGFVCADVRGGNPAAHTPIQASDCHAGPDQQFMFNS